MNILVVGQSHVAAIRAAAKARREADPERPRTRVIHTMEPQYAPEIEGAADGDFAAGRFAAPLEAAIRDQVARHAPLVASAMGGNAHNSMSLIRHDRPFDFALADGAGPPPDPAAEPIPLALVRAALERRLVRDRARMRLLRAAAGPFVQIESPPPVRDSAWIAARADEYFRRAGEAAPPIADAGLRWRIWRLNAGLFRQWSAELGCRYLPAPAETQDVDGFLRLDFAGDATHGNQAYGEAVIAMLETMR